MKCLPSNYTEDRLVTELRQGSQKAYSLLYDQYAPTLFGIINKILLDEEASRDILQDVFIKIHQKINYYDNTKGRLFTWLINITRNTAFDEIRNKKIHLRIDEVDLNLFNNRFCVAYNNVNVIGINELIRSLPTETESIFELIYFEGYTHLEVAKMLEMPVGTVKTRIRIGLQKLRKYA